jgi:hypothetical protein
MLDGVGKISYKEARVQRIDMLMLHYGCCTTDAALRMLRYGYCMMIADISGSLNLLPDESFCSILGHYSLACWITEIIGFTKLF